MLLLLEEDEMMIVEAGEEDGRSMFDDRCGVELLSWVRAGW